MVRNYAVIAGITAAVTMGGTTAAYAALDYLGTADLQGTGIGAENTVLTIQSPRNTASEKGSVGLDADGRQITSGNVLKGNSQTRVRSFGSVGITAASDLRIVFNAQEPGHDADSSVTFSDLVLNVFSPTGALLLSTSAFTPRTFDSTRTGVGRAGEVFGLDETEAAQLQTVAGKGLTSDFLGLAATVNNATGGPETFFVTSAGGLPPLISLVPEPRTLALFAAGMFAVIFRTRCRSRSA